MSSSIKGRSRPKICRPEQAPRRSGKNPQRSVMPEQRLARSSLRVASSLTLAVLVVLFSTLAKADDAASVEWFEKKIRPVLVKHCYECHSAGSKDLGGKLRLDFRDGLLEGGESGPAVSVGKPDSSPLILALKYDGLEMPPSGKLPDSVIADFEKWIQLGLTDPRTPPKNDEPERAKAITKESLWSLQPIVEHEIPVTISGWAETPIDQFIAERHAAEGLTVVADASPRDLLRRVSFDLTGLPPSYEEIKEFEREFSTERYAAIVDEMLASPRFGERWGRHWLDVARFAESNGNDRNVIFPHAWRYRDYVIRSFNTDKPFDQFVREQIAGDLMPSEHWQQRDEQLIATGLLTLGSKVLGEGDKDLFEMNLIDEQIDVMSRAFLGLTINCARCHDHKFDPIPTRGYYALAGIFGSTESLYGPMTNANKYGFDRPLQPIGENGIALDGPAKAYREKVAEVTGVRNKARSSRYGFVRKKAALENEQKRTTDAKRLAEIADEMKTQDVEIAVWDKKIEALDADLKELTDNPPEFPDYCMAVRDLAEPNDCAVRVRGEVKQKGHIVPRGVPTLFDFQRGAELSKQSSGRLILADWLVDDKNPLTARVAVNRIWQHLFGRGLVDTPDNFGRMGKTPNHPKLLDWLASRFKSKGWSIKQTIREIVLSRTYRLSSGHSSTNNEADQANTLLWRAPVKRLDAESLRDAMLDVSCELELTPPEGSIVSSFEEREFNDRVRPSAEQLSSVHRSVYLPVARYWVPDMLREFDFADPSLVVGKRTERTMASQSLFLMNSQFVTDRARQIAEDVVAQPEAERAATAFRRILLRDPTIGEATRLAAFVRNSSASNSENSPKSDGAGAAWQAACQTLLMTAEFRYVP
ncbi:MAG: hypothetical protein ACI93T_001297 [Porticoccaceae bacterium]|jgi:hypothetical protein